MFVSLFRKNCILKAVKLRGDLLSTFARTKQIRKHIEGNVGTWKQYNNDQNLGEMIRRDQTLQELYEALPFAQQFLAEEPAKLKAGIEPQQLTRNITDFLQLDKPHKRLIEHINLLYSQKQILDKASQVKPKKPPKT